jgi:hypothetical protein
LFAGGEPEGDEQVGLAGAGVAEQHDRLAGVEVGAGGEGGQSGRGDGGHGVDVEVGEAFDAGELRLGDASGAAALGPVVDFGGEYLGQEAQVGRPLA